MEGVIGFTTLFAGNFAPKSWAFCAGQTVTIASNTALFSILGTSFGGNGTTTFGLPDLRARALVGTGNGPGLSPYTIGQSGGNNTATLTLQQMPSHVHPVTTTVTPKANGSTNANASSPNNAVYATDPNGNLSYGLDPTVNMKPFQATLTMTNTGSDAPFSIQRPYLGLNYIICQFGVFPARN